jgi:hypothetical protein
VVFSTFMERTILTERQFSEIQRHSGALLVDSAD